MRYPTRSANLGEEVHTVTDRTPDPEEVLAWMEETGNGYRKASKHFGIPYEMVKKWKRGGTVTSKSTLMERVTRARASGAEKSVEEQIREIATGLIEVIHQSLAIRLDPDSPIEDQILWLKSENQVSQQRERDVRSLTRLAENFPDVLQVLSGSEPGVDEAGEAFGDDAAGRLRAALGLEDPSAKA